MSAIDGLLGCDDPRLAPSADLALARGTLAALRAHDAEQARVRDDMLAFVDAHPDALQRSCRTGHLTASCLVLDAERHRGLLTLHRKLGRWLQLGGHCDGDGNLPAVALREAVEESGIAGLVIDPEPIDVDVHSIPACAGEPRHLHLDTRFVVLAPPGARLVRSGESIELGWVGVEELDRIEADASLRRLFARALG